MLPSQVREHLCCQTVLAWALLVMLSLLMGQLCRQQEQLSLWQVRPFGCSTKSMC